MTAGTAGAAAAADALLTTHLCSSDRMNLASHWVIRCKSNINISITHFQPPPPFEGVSNSVLNRCCRTRAGILTEELELSFSIYVSFPLRGLTPRFIETLVWRFDDTRTRHFFNNKRARSFDSLMKHDNAEKRNRNGPVRNQSDEKLLLWPLLQRRLLR